MSRRAQITMTPEEVEAFVAAGRVANLATVGRGGRPHLVPLWYVPRGPGLETWTYASSQKAVNLRRLPQATVLIEAGETYDQLRGVSLECDVELVTDRERVARIGSALARRYNPNEQIATAATQFVRLQAAKRIGLVCTPTRIVSWDHRKLGGTY
ncbi:pyridoxamine 5'-phosphate oxidase [Actinophytocola xinjiangensis]|uniref:Pyridoxamine 5'-phosphate oxidase n=1 Tax=Actinophytocola xinjiangensis TaxID=485602 RepID=A0A7Z0WLK9_9PSEU|nr:pyridoxamine 5'-phosphate oxidase family protein [Actinophytocola xinjiangensis]OLF09458.1 pyridoxamine 5'-phosphate oxidase [Actinophytocola xinjiangensis]